MNNNPIGIFDSGVGGLSVFSKLYNILPDENYIYFGDTKNLPYGNKSKEELIEISVKIFDFFKEQNVKAVVMACNTTSAITYESLKDNYDFKIYPIVQSVAKQIANEEYKNIGVFATNATINSHAYKNELQKVNPNINVFEQACPHWVPIVENSLQEEDESIEDVRLNLEKMMENYPEKIILGCTHYPYLLDILSRFKNRYLFINPAEYFAKYIAEDLENSNLLCTKKADCPIFYVSSNPTQFKISSKLFFDVEIVKEVSL